MVIVEKNFINLLTLYFLLIIIPIILSNKYHDKNIINKDKGRRNNVNTKSINSIDNNKFISDKNDLNLNKLEEDAIKFLYRYGYLRSTKLKDKNNDIKRKRFKRGIEKFQKFVGLNNTGYLDNETIKLMKISRCGNKDVFKNTRGRRYVFEGSHWGKVNISWTISQHSSKFPRHLVYRTISRAFGVWQHDTPLTFSYVKNGPADIKVGFFKRKHGDDEDFDGPGGILGHGYFPRYGGEVHFDDDEYFSIGSHHYQGISLFSTAVHEIGHSLGLKHSYRHDSIMRPFYHLSPLKYFKLGRDDIEGIFHIYGRYLKLPSKNYSIYSYKKNYFFNTNKIPLIVKKDKNTTINKNLSKTQYSYQFEEKIKQEKNNLSSVMNMKPYNKKIRPPNLCKDSSIDAIVELLNETVIIFKDNWIFHLENSKIVPSKTKRISDFWPSITGRIDGITMDVNGDFYMFQQNKYWILDRNLSIRKNYPNYISKGIPNLGSDNIDAVFHFYLNELPYIFKNDTYWIFKSNQRHPSIKKPISSIFKNCDDCKIPLKIDAAYSSSSGLSYIFVGKEYYRLQNKHPLRIASGFPQDNAKHFFGCN
uniref:ZnMc domain-containing protein n=1 Tax=Strongyloides stercoralis TaxID=6248 RepID=A0A0K0DUJ1_STRER